MFGVAALVLVLITDRSLSRAQNPKDAIVDPEKAGPEFLIQGEYEGLLDGKEKLGAQVVAKGGGKFVGDFLPGGLPGAGWNGKIKHKLEVKTVDGKSIVSGAWTGVIAEGRLTGKTDKGQEFVLGRVVRKSPTLGMKAPQGAIILFDGSSASEWNGGQLVEGNLLKMGTSSKKKFGDVKLHVEFRAPFQPFSGGQGRGNSGVYLQGRHEVQVLDSFGLKAGGGDCGALYGERSPDLNMSFPPLSWQTYDIEYRTARYDAQGKKMSGAKITVLHNGVKIHDNYEYKNSGNKPGEDKPGAINLQNHGNPVYYRNIWVVELK
jgi:hypothetical protein